MIPTSGGRTYVRLPFFFAILLLILLVFFGVITECLLER